MIKETPKFIEFLKKAFDAKEVSRNSTPDGSVMHAEIKIGDSMKISCYTRAVLCLC